MAASPGFFSFIQKRKTNFFDQESHSSQQGSEEQQHRVGQGLLLASQAGQCWQQWQQQRPGHPHHLGRSRGACLLASPVLGSV